MPKPNAIGVRLVRIAQMLTRGGHRDAAGLSLLQEGGRAKGSAIYALTPSGKHSAIAAQIARSQADAAVQQRKSLPIRRNVQRAFKAGGIGLTDTIVAEMIKMQEQA